MEQQELTELSKTIPVIQTDVNIIKKSITDISSELTITKNTISKVITSMERLDSSTADISSIRYTVKTLQNNIDTITDKIRDLTEKTKDLITSLKVHDDVIADKYFTMMKSIMKIDSQTKESISKHENTENVIGSLTTMINDLSKRENIVENTITKDDSVSTLEKVIKIAPNLITILSFLGYIIYTLIEHKLQGKF